MSYWIKDTRERNVLSVIMSGVIADLQETRSHWINISKATIDEKIGFRDDWILPDYGDIPIQMSEYNF